MHTTHPGTSRDPVDTLWRIFDGVQDRIGAADTKISVAIGLELGALTATAALAGTRAGGHTPLGGLLVLGAAMLVLTAAILAALSALTPRLHGPRGADAAANLLYFGTLRALAPGELAALARRVDLLAHLSRQTVQVSAIAWIKHTRLSLSLRLAGAGIVLAAAAALVLAS